LRISYEEVVRLTNRLSEAVDTQHSLEMKIKECEQLKAENTRLTVTALQMAKEKADAQSKSLMYEHDLELARVLSNLPLYYL
jgi:FtsZ-binding cell division protein ZapB